MGTDEEREALAHVLRRCTFGPDPGQVDALGGIGPRELVRLVLDHAADPSIDSGFDDPVFDVPAFDGDDDDPAQLQQWWVRQMLRSGTGLHERLVWFWHGHFTTSRDKAPPVHLAKQLSVLRRFATGNFRELAKKLVVDGAMLLYLDGSGSQGEDPNENLARELMELFVLGRGTYTETDVRNVARALSGWWAEWDADEVVFDPDSAYPGVVEVLGVRGRLRADDVIDILCDQPDCARHVAAAVHECFVGGPLGADRLEELADIFRSSGLEILPLVEGVLDHPDFHRARRNRPKLPLEWLVPAARSLDIAGFESWELEVLGQAPFLPPTPAGWPGGDRWLSPGQMLTRLNLINNREWDVEFDFDESDPVPDVLSHCGIFELSDTTRAALDEAFWAPLDAQWANRLMLTLAVTSPEYALA